jgi:murein DD-endopeptidase MepM/ murein hydrolase activator NlpD
MIEHLFYLVMSLAHGWCVRSTLERVAMMRSVADRGLQAYAVPSARAGQQTTDPAARRDALSGLLTGGFLLAVIAIVLAIVIAAPQYAKPAALVAVAPIASGEPVPSAAPADTAAAAAMTSAPPEELKGYRWPVRDGQVIRYFRADKAGRFEVDGRRFHDGIVITRFEGAPVKAAHKGKVMAVGRDWVREAGYKGSPDQALARFDKELKGLKKQGREADEYPLGVVIDDGNGYYSIYTELQDIRVEVDQEVEAGQVLGSMARAEGLEMMRYRLVRMDGRWMKVHASDRKLGYPGYARERVDPLAVLRLDAKRMPELKGKRPKAPPGPSGE